jgi:hypothetical protein
MLAGAYVGTLSPVGTAVRFAGAGVTSLRGDFRKRKIEGQTEGFLLVGE